MTMVEVKVSELSGAALDWAVAKIEGYDLMKHPFRRAFIEGVGHVDYRPSTDWSQGGPLIERYSLEIVFDGSRNYGWRCVKDWCYGEVNDTYPLGETHLIAACRAIVASKFGDAVSVPAELVEVAG